jgi:hypothetical protein
MRLMGSTVGHLLRFFFSAVFVSVGVGQLTVVEQLSVLWIGIDGNDMSRVNIRNCAPKLSWPFQWLFIVVNNNLNLVLNTLDGPTIAFQSSIQLAVSH